MLGNYEQGRVHENCKYQEPPIWLKSAVQYTLPLYDIIACSSVYWTADFIHSGAYIEQLSLIRLQEPRGRGSCAMVWHIGHSNKICKYHDPWTGVLVLGCGNYQIKLQSLWSRMQRSEWFGTTNQCSVFAAQVSFTAYGSLFFKISYHSISIIS